MFLDEWHVDAPQEAVFNALADACTYPEWWRPTGALIAPEGSIEWLCLPRWGNFPQAFTHLALINAVSRVISDDRSTGDRDRTAVFTEMISAQRD